MSQEISKSLKHNISTLKSLYAQCADVVQKEIYVGTNQYPIYVIYMDSMIDRDLIEAQIIKNMMYALGPVPANDALVYIRDHGMPTADVTAESSLDNALTMMMSGDTLFFVDGFDQVLVINSRGFPGRGVPTAEVEVAVRGSKESFSESMRLNTVLIRRRIREPKLKLKQVTVGTRTKTDVGVMYVDDLVRPDVLEELEKRISGFEIDGIFDSGSLEQILETEWFSPFPQFQYTERPDKASSALLEGRVVVVIDNSPTVLMLPTTAGCFFQASDDYYSRWGIMTFTRILRYIAAFVAALLPALYIAIAQFHPEVFPTNLILSFAAARQGVPFPLAFEVLLMELSFELLREAGVRLPGPMGGSLGIVGGIIIGQAAVEAKLISPVVVIIVAMTALAAFTIPNESFGAAIRQVKFYLIVLSMFLGLLGFVLGVMTIFIHLASLKSFNIPYLMPFVAGNVNGNEDRKDGFGRSPIRMMKRRPIFTRDNARTRFRQK